MESIVKKLSEIEDAASAIVAKAEGQKADLDAEYQAMNKAFDEELEKETQAQLQVIRNEHDENIKELLAEQSEANKKALSALQADYDNNHSKYAESILKSITAI